MSYLHFLVSISSFVLLISAVSSAPSIASDKSCNELRTAITENIDKLLIILDETWTGFASKEELVKDYCEPFNTWMKPAKEFKNCLKGFQKTIYNMVMNKVRKIYKTYCLNDEKLSEIYQHLSCAQNETIITLRHTATQMIAYFEGSATINGTQERMIPAICCGALDLVEKANKVINETCFPVTNDPKTADFLVELVFSVFADVFDLLCSGTYPTFDKCLVMQPNTTAYMQNYIDEAKLAFPDTPLLDHFLTIISRLDETIDN